MFDIGFQEMAVIGIIGLIVIGPERLPRVARNIGRWVGRVRRYVSQVRDDIEREIHADELREIMNKPSEKLGDLYEVAEQTKGALADAKASVDSAAREMQAQVDDGGGGGVEEESPADSTAGDHSEAPAEVSAQSESESESESEI